MVQIYHKSVIMTTFSLVMCHRMQLVTMLWKSKQNVTYVMMATPIIMKCIL